jgi:exosortase
VLNSRESILELRFQLAFASLVAISLAIYWGPLTSSFALALHDDQYTHILLILPISVALICLDWKSPEPSSRSSVSLGSALLIMVALVTAVVRWRPVALSPDLRLSVNMLALVTWWIAAFILCFGARAFRRAVFPLCFLLWMVPFPDFVLNPIISLLQRGSAATAHLFFAMAGVPVAQKGVMLHIPGLIIEVATECSSIRSSTMLLVTTMVLAQMLLRSPWRKALVVAVAIPLSVVKNGLRIFVIAMLATRVDSSFLTGRLHRQGGIIFFLIALVAIFLVLWTMRRGEEEKRARGDL